MNKEENNFEEFLRSKLENHTVEVSDSVWDNIEKKQKNRDFFVWFRQHLNIFIALDLVFISGLAALTLLNFNEVQSKNNTNITHQLAIDYKTNNSRKQIEQVNKIASAEAESKQLIDHKKINKKSGIIIEKQAISSIKEDVLATDNKPQTILNKKEKLSKKQNEVQADRLQEQVVHEQVIQENNLHSSASYTSIPLMTMRATSNINLGSLYINESKLEPSFLPPSLMLSKSKKVIKAQEKAIEKAEKEKVKEATAAALKTNIEVLKKKEVIENHASNNSAQEKTQSNEPTPMALDTVYGKKKFNGYIAIDALFSPEIAGRNLTGSNQTVMNYISRRDSAETMRLAYSALMRMNLFINRNVFINTGISYSQRKEKFSILHQWQKNEEYIDSSKFVTYVDPFEGNIIYKTYDTLNYVRSYKDSISHQLVMSFVDIPVMIGYKWLGKRSGIAIQGGVIFNMIFKQRGTMANFNYTANDVNTNTQNPFNSHAGLSLAGGITTNHKLGNKLDLIIEPHTRYTLRSITNSNYALQQKLFTYGLNVGLRLKL